MSSVSYRYLPVSHLDGPFPKKIFKPKWPRTARQLGLQLVRCPSSHSYLAETCEVSDVSTIISTLLARLDRTCSYRFSMDRCLPSQFMAAIGDKAGFMSSGTADKVDARFIESALN